jgi:iron complex transport system substrate-binding protein
MRSITAGGLLATILLAAACGGDDTTANPAAGAPTSNTASAASGASTVTATSAPPTTALATTAPSGIAPGGEAVAAAYAAVFDSAVSFDQKAPYLVDAEALRPTVEAYAAAGQRFGGIKLVPTAVTTSGPTAAVTYDVLFGTTTQYRALQGSAIQEGGGWKVTRAEFCSFMASARTPCPAQ